MNRLRNNRPRAGVVLQGFVLQGLVLCGLLVIAIPIASAIEPAVAKPAPTAGSNRNASMGASGSALVTPANTTLQPPPVSFESEPIHFVHAPASGNNPVTSGNAPANAPGNWGLSRVPAALVGVLVLIFAMRWFLTKFSPAIARQKPTRAVEVLARSPIAPRQQLMLVRVGKRVVLVGNSGTAMSSLCQIDDPDEVAMLIGQIQEERTSIVKVTSSFRSMFGRANTEYKHGVTDDTDVASDEEDVTVGSRPSSRVAMEDELSARPSPRDLLDREMPQDKVEISGMSMPASSMPRETHQGKPKPDSESEEALASGDLSELVAKVRRMSQGFQQ